MGEHRLVQIGRDDRALAAQAGEQSSGDEAGAARDFEYSHSRPPRDPRGQVVREAMEEHGPKVAVVVLRHGTNERVGAVGHTFDLRPRSILPAMHDLVIDNALVIDGLGTPARAAASP